MAVQSLSDLSARLARGEISSRTLVESALRRIMDPAGEGQRTFTRVFGEKAELVAEATDKLHAAGEDLRPLAGLPISVKDLFDIRGEVTTAGSRLLINAPAAAADATIVTRLKRAGAIIIGRTNMTEFAYSGIGLNPHLGTPANPFRRRERLIPGGSSSGAAISVTDGMACAAIGSDTGGSVRIPAALCGLTGFKPTQRRVPITGAFPLSPTLDSVGPIAPTVSCCRTIDAVLAGERLSERRAVDLSSSRFVLPRNYLLDDLQAPVAVAFERAISRLSEAGAKIVELPLREMERIREINATGGFSAIEAYAFHRKFGLNMEEYYPRVLERILRGKDVSAADYLDMHENRAAIITKVNQAMAGFDGILTPTVPIVAPAIADVADLIDEYRRINFLLLRNPSVFNFLDGCSLSIPCHEEGEAPVGLMISDRQMQDKALLSVGLTVERLVSPYSRVRKSASSQVGY